MTHFKFSSRRLAKDFANRCLKAQLIILGDDGFFWVCSMRDGERLIKNGYQVAK